MVLDAVHESCAHGAARTSLIGGIIMAAGTLIALAVLPGRRKAGADGRTEPQESRTAPEEHAGV